MTFGRYKAQLPAIWRHTRVCTPGDVTPGNNYGAWFPVARVPNTIHSQNIIRRFCGEHGEIDHRRLWHVYATLLAIPVFAWKIATLNAVSANAARSRDTPTVTRTTYEDRKRCSCSCGSGWTNCLPIDVSWGWISVKLIIAVVDIGPASRSRLSNLLLFKYHSRKNRKPQLQSLETCPLTNKNPVSSFRSTIIVHIDK